MQSCTFIIKYDLWYSPCLWTFKQMVSAVVVSDTELKQQKNQLKQTHSRWSLEQNSSERTMQDISSQFVPYRLSFNSVKGIKWGVERQKEMEFSWRNCKLTKDKCYHISLHSQGSTRLAMYSYIAVILLWLFCIMYFK